MLLFAVQYLEGVQATRQRSLTAILGLAALSLAEPRGEQNLVVSPGRGEEPRLGLDTIPTTLD